MFCDLVGSTEMSQHLDPEVLREVNREYQDSVTAAIERFNEWGIDSVSHVPYLLNLMGIEVPALAEIDSGLVGYRTREALVSILLAHGKQGPVVLYINDCHWIDKSSEALLETLIYGAAKNRIIILCTFRPEYVPPWADTVSVNKVWLNLLSLSETKALLADRFAGA